MTYVVTQSCIQCKYTDCVDVCPVDCFVEGPNFLAIDPEECIDCTLCVAECPVEAIFSEDDVPEDVKMDRANQIMEIQSQISWELNQQKIGKEFKIVVDRKEGNFFIGRTEFDSPDVDNEVLVDATKFYLKTGDYAMVKVTEAEDFDLYAEPLVALERPQALHAKRATKK